VLWQSTGTPPPWKAEFDQWAVRGILKAIAFPEKGPIDPGILSLIPYRPDLLLEVGPAALEHSGLRSTIFEHPRCALALLLTHYEELADKLEPALVGSGECVFHLLKWADETRCVLRREEDFYRRILVRDTYWGFLQAKRTDNASLLADVAAWSSDERHKYAAAAAHFLLTHAAEPVGPYRKVLLGDPFYAYLALPRLSLRGFAVAPEDIGISPKWACHFAWSEFSTRRDEFIPMAEPDPGWLVELAGELGWLANPLRLSQLGNLIPKAGAGHPLQRPAMQCLSDIKKGSPVGQVATFKV
jgi:hypothetical protein